MADKLIKILIEAENKASDQFKQLHKELKKIDEQAKKTAESLQNLKDKTDVSNDIGKNNAAIDKNTRKLKDNTEEINDNKDANKELTSNMSGVLSVASKLGTVLVALGGFYTIAASKALELNKELIANSTIAGTNIKDFQKLAIAYKAFGIESSDVASAIKDVNERINDAVFNKSGEFVDISKALGLDPASLAELGKANPAAAYQKVLDVLTKIEDKQVRQAFADRLGSDALNKIVSTTVQFGDEIDRIQKSVEGLDLGITEEQQKKLNGLSAAWTIFAENFVSLSNEVVIDSIPKVLKLIEVANEFVSDLRKGTSENFNLLKAYFTFLGTEIPLFFIKAAKQVGELNLKILEMLNLEELAIAQRQRISELNRDIASFSQKSINNTEKAKLQLLSDQGKKLTEEQDLRLKLIKAYEDENLSLEEKQKLLEQGIKLFGEQNREVIQLKENLKQVNKEAAKIGEIEIAVKGIQGIDAINNQLLTKGTEGAKLTTRNKFEIERLELAQGKQEITKLQKSELAKVEKLLNDNADIIKIKSELRVGVSEQDLQKESANLINETKKLVSNYTQELEKGNVEAAKKLRDGILKNISEFNLPPEEIKKAGEIVGSSFNAGLLISTKEQDIVLAELTEKYRVLSSGATAGINSQAEAQKALNELTAKTAEIYGKNSSEYKDLMIERANISKENFQKEIENINYLRDTNQISIQEQIDLLEKLRSQTSKNSEEFKGLTLTIQQLKEQNFQEDLNKLNLQYRLNEKSLDDLIAAYDQQLISLEDNSVKTLQLRAARQDLIDQKLSEDFEKLNLEIELGSKNFDDLIKKYKAYAETTKKGSLENLQAQLFIKQTEDQKNSEIENLFNARLQSSNLLYEERIQLIQEYNEFLKQQRDLYAENTAEYIKYDEQIKANNDSVTELKLSFGELAEMISQDLGDNFMEVLKGTKSLKDAFKDTATSILGDLTSMIIKSLIFKSIMGAFGMAGINPGANIFGDFSGSATASLPTRHNGGWVGAAGDSGNGFKNVDLLNPSASLSPNERLIVAKTDEYVVKSPTINSPTGVGTNSVVSPNLNIQNYITDKSFADIMANSDNIQDTIINIINRNNDKIMR
jgi:hypothetical protein